MNGCDYIPRDQGPYNSDQGWWPMIEKVLKYYVTSFVQFRKKSKQYWFEIRIHFWAVNVHECDIWLTWEAAEEEEKEGAEEEEEEEEEDDGGGGEEEAEEERRGFFRIRCCSEPDGCGSPRFLPLCFCFSCCSTFPEPDGGNASPPRIFSAPFPVASFFMDTCCCCCCCCCYVSNVTCSKKLLARALSLFVTLAVQEVAICPRRIYFVRFGRK